MSADLAPASSAQLGAAPQGGNQGGAAPRAGQRTCTECGAAYAPTAPHGEFCSPGCRRAWGNRRALRGALIYDLFMALRYDRPLATKLRLWGVICRAAAQFRREDDELRGGRRSWVPPITVLQRRPSLRATVLVAGKKRP